MCHKNVFAYVYPDGRRVEQVKHDLCKDSRHGKPCGLTKTFQHPPEYVRSGQLSPPAFSYGQFPPTPPLSSHSASDSEHSSKERSGIYVNGEKVVDLNNKRSSRREKSERNAYTDSPPLPRTPPRRYSVTRGSPPSPRDVSPRDEAIPIYESRRREKNQEERDRPTSSHSRPSIEVKVVNEQRRDSVHRRNGSNKSSSQDSDEDSERRRRRRSSHVRFEDDEKSKKIQSEIERQNEAIANRPAIPATSGPLSTKYRRGSVVVDPTSTSLVAAMDNLKIIEREKQRQRDRQAAELRERERERLREEEAQKQRLMERMAPKRRATVSSGHVRGNSNGRPQKVLYDDGRYYWE